MDLSHGRLAVIAAGDRRGFSLVSVVVAIVILTVGLMAVASTQTVIATSETNMASRNVALQLARSHMELLRSRDPRTLASESAVRVDGHGVPSAVGAYARSVIVVTEQTNLLRVTVNVDYPRMRTPIQLTTLSFRPSS